MLEEVPEDVVNHPIVLWVMIGVVALVVLAIGARRLALTLAPGWEWWRRREQRELRRQAEIEAAAQLLNDQRVTILLHRVDGLTAEIVAQRDELTGALQEQRAALIAQRDEERRRADAAETLLRDVSQRLDEALDLIVDLKRGGHADVVSNRE